MRMICYPTSGALPDIRPAPATRGWMDRLPDAFAYRCLPLNIANAHGWHVLCPARVEAVWDGSPDPAGIRVSGLGAANQMPVSHFGHGVLTFHVVGLFRTPPGVNMWVSGPANSPKDGIYAMAGIIETDWAPYGFTMNWMFTRPNHPVVFEKGEPFCQIFPLQRGLADGMEPEFQDMSTDPELERHYKAWVEARNSFNRDLHVPGSAAQAEKWQKIYYRGLMPDDTPGPPEHQSKIRMRPFVDRRPPPPEPPPAPPTPLIGGGYYQQD